MLVSLAAAALTCATYLAYTVFDDWWYIRFLLPALPVVAVLSVAVLLEPARGRPRLRAGMAVGACALVVAWHVHAARTHQVFDLQALESRFALAGRYAGRALPAGAVVLAMQQSGSIRYYGGRATIAWDAIPPGALDATIEALRAAGRPRSCLEDAEERRSARDSRRERFGRPGLAAGGRDPCAGAGADLRSRGPGGLPAGGGVPHGDVGAR